MMLWSDEVSGQLICIIDISNGSINKIKNIVVSRWRVDKLNTKIVIKIQKLPVDRVIWCRDEFPVELGNVKSPPMTELVISQT